MTGTMTFRVVARDERLPPELQARLASPCLGSEVVRFASDSRWMLINFGPDIVDVSEPPLGAPAHRLPIAETPWIPLPGLPCP
jgi:hypothetical protein